MLFALALFAAFVVALAWRAVGRRPADEPGWPVHRTLRGVLAGVFLALAAIAATQFLTVVPAGHVGVVDLFGSVSPRSLRSGIHLRNPLARIVPMSIKTEELKEIMEVPSKEGLTMALEGSVLFHLDPDKAPDVYKTLGPAYVGILLEPQFRSVTRGVTASYEAKALYTSEREAVAELIASELRKIVEPRGIAVESTPLRKLTLPARLAAAIEEKLSAEQESQRMEFVLARESKEAERKRIEAAGISDFQRIVSEGISEQLLRWKGIEATMEIAKSPNAKVVVVGAGKDGLPLILGAQ
ncbi:MAG: prohibitin family protein [Thermoanaerobaculia bacterium]|nr:prohibitin family protein [Thermoanaerobaculia bacterium]